MRKKFLLMLTLLILALGGSGNLFAAEENVAMVGDKPYATIDEAIAAWTNNTTLTLLADVKLSGVVTLKSTEHHILNLGTYTMTAASGNNAFVIKACGTGDAERTAITIKADATNPGGINAGSKCVIYYKYADGGISTTDRPIIKIEGGVFTGSTSSWGTAGIYTIGTEARKCATLNISGGTFNCSINGSGKSKLLVSGGIFNYSVGSQGDSTALRLISGGRFKTLGFMTADSNNTKFWFGTSMGNSNVGLYVDKNGYLCVGGPVITETSKELPAVASNPTKWSSYLAYSSAATYGLFYEDVDMAIAKHGAANVTVWVKPAVTIPENVEGDATVVEEIKNNTALNGYTPENLPEGAELEIVLNSVGETFVYDVTPMANGVEVEPTEDITFRLPVPASVTAVYARVYHEETLMGVYDIKGEGNAKYVEIASADFSKFAIEPITHYEVATYQDLIDALANDGAYVIMTADITATATQSSGYGKAGIVLDAGDVLDGNGKTLTINGAGATWDCAIAMRGGEVKTLTIAGAMRGVFMPGANGDVVIDYCVFKNVVYTFNSDAGSKNHTVTIKNTTLNGWTSFSNAHKAVVFESCEFGEGSGYAFCRPYQATTFIDCGFNEGYKFDTKSTTEVLAFEECTYNDLPLSEENNAMFYNGGSVVIDGTTTDVNHYVATIGNAKYLTLEDAFTAATEGQTITLLADATPALTSQRAITKAAVIDLDGNTLNLTEDDLYFGTTTFKNGTIEVDPSVNASTAVFWMFANQTLTFDKVKVVATGVTGTYLIGLEGVNSHLNLLNGSEIVIDNTDNTDFIVIAHNGNGNILVKDSKIDINNVGRGFLKGNVTISGSSEINLKGISKAGFRIEAGQTLSIEDTSEVTVEGTLRDGGIHLTDPSANYTKAETATVNATINQPQVAKVGNTIYKSLIAAVADVEDGGTITLIANETFTKTNRTHNSGTWYDGLYYVGDKSFTIDLGGFTISQDGAVNDYLLNFKNSGSKANTITLKNGTIDAGTAAFCAICTSSSQANELTINTEEINIINEISNGSTIKLRGGAVLNVKAGTKITGKNSYLGIECVASTVNIYDGAKIYMNGTTSYNGCLVGACGGGTVNVYGGYGKGAKGGFIAMTSGGTINVEGGEWIANTDGTVGNNSNVYVLTAQSNKNEQGFVGPAIINVTGGTFRGGMGAWVLNNHKDEKAELNIKGGNFNANPTSYVAADYIAVENNGVWNVVKAAAKIGANKYASLEEAFKAATTDCTIEILSDVTVDYAWDARYTGGKFTVPVTINGNGKTIKFTASVNDNNYQAPFRFEADATVKNLTIDMSAATDNRFRAISSKGNLTVDNCKFIGKDESLNCRAIIFGEGAGTNVGNLAISITNSEFNNWKRGITDNENGQDVKNVTITHNTLEDAAVYVSAKEKVTFTNNTVEGAYVNIKSYTTSNKLAVTAIDNDLEDNTETTYNSINAGGAINAQDEFNVVAKGNNFNGYVGTDRIWGEVWGNARKSFVIKVLDANDVVMGTTSLNNVGGIINGNVNVSWNLKLDAESNTDEYWEMVWTTAPNINNMPAKVELWVDGVKVSGGNVVLNGPDDLNKIYAAVTNADGKILSYHTSIANAVAAGNNVAILKAGSYALQVKDGLTITGAVNGVEFANIGEFGCNGANVTFNNVTFTYAENSTYKGLQHSGNLVYNNCTFNGQVFLYGQSETFNICTFNTEDSDNYNVWTYGAKEVAFNNCTFNSAGKSVLIYHENATMFNDVAVTKSTFNASQTVEGKAAIEMDSSLTGGINLTIDGETTATGFGKGNVSGNSLWNNKKGVTSEDNNDITVIINGETVLSPAPIMVTYPKGNPVYAEGKVEFYHNMLEAVPYTTNCPRLEGATIKLLDDVAAPGLRFMENGMVFDLNGKIYTITAGTGSQGTNTSGFQIRPEVTTNVVFKNGTINVAEGAPVVYMFNNYATNFIVENVTVDCSNMAWSYGNSCYVVVSSGNQTTTGLRNVEFKGSTKIENFDSDKAGIAYSIDGNMTVEEYVIYGGTFKLSEGATLIAKEGLEVVTGEGLIIVYKNGEYKSVAIVAKSYNTNGELVANYGDFESAIAAATANTAISRIEVVSNYEQKSVANTSSYYDVKQDLTIAATEGNNYIVNGCGFKVRVQNAATLTIANNLTIEGLDVVANGFGTSGENMVIDGTIKALSLKQWTSNGTITVNGKVELGYGDGQFDMAYGNGEVVVNGNDDKTVVQFKAGYSGTRGNGGTLTLNDTYFEAGAWFNVAGSNTTINVNNSLLKVSGGDHNGALTLATSNVIKLDINSQIVSSSISGDGTITIDAADFVIGGGDVQVVYATINVDENNINVVNNNYVTAVITETGIVIKENNLEGEGTVDNPYVLETLTELELFRNKVNAGDNYAGEYVKLTADVDLSATRSANNWEPIGTTSNPFKGKFDGDGNTISNLVVEGGNYVGLFGKTVGATINNVTIKNANVRGTSYVGAIVGMGHTGTINNCHVIGNVQIEGNYMVGGISGQGYAIIYNSSVIATANSNSYVKGVYSTANLEGDNVGGIVGHCGENNTLTANTVKNITVSGTRKVGGIVGIADMSTDIDACVVENVTIETSASQDYADDNINTMSIGALIGQYQNRGSNGTVTNSTVKNVTFKNVNGVTVNGRPISAGPITGGTRGGSEGMSAPTGVTASNNDIYMSTIKGNSNLYLMNAVAEIEGVEYYTLQDAFNAGGEVVVLRDITLAETATIPAGKVVTLDLNGWTISQEKACTGNYSMILNKGNLTIEGNGRIRFKDTGAGDPDFGWGSYTLRNEGTLVVENGTIEHLGEQNPGNGQPNVHMYCAIFQYSGSSTIIGGTISTPTYRSARLWKGDMTINGGTFEGQVWVQAVDNSADLKINGGTFAPRGNDGSSVYVENSSKTVAFEVTGGKFETKIGVVNAEALAGCITGGQFSEAAKNGTATKLIDARFKFEEMPNNGYYSIIQFAGTQTRELVENWNWFSTYIDSETLLQDLKAELNPNGIQIKGQDGYTQFYSGYGANGAWSPGLTSISPTKMYMIRTNDAVEVELEGDFVEEDRKIILNSGWNWIGYPVRESVYVKDAIRNIIPTHGDVIKSQLMSAVYMYGTWFIPASQYGDFYMNPGEGYMYYSNAVQSFDFSYSKETSATTRTSTEPVEYHWIANAAQYPSNMTVIAMLNIDGEVAADNYEVAAFANGECRGSARPVYVDAIDSYVLVMTISGEEVEELTFKCYDVNYGTEYELSNRFNYSSDAILGSADEPYMFFMNTLNIEESTLDMINIYPNPTTTDRAISLQATCDNVEVFNALGVKVAEYQNVDSIDALETAGIYVIRVTINGEVKNCRLVVK